MKKLDILIIIFVVLVGSTIFITYFKKVNVNTDDALLGIYYKEILLDDPISLEESTNLVYELESTEDLERIKVTRNNLETTKSEVYYVQAKHTLHVDHRIIITYNDIRVTKASCDGQDCLRGRMSHVRTLPIICIVGVNIMFNNFEIITGA
jgi:hypothetical protein